MDDPVRNPEVKNVTGMSFLEDARYPLELHCPETGTGAIGGYLIVH